MNAPRHHPLRTAAVVVLALAAGGCNILTRLSEIGSDPRLSDITNPTAQPNYRPVSLPMPAPQVAENNPASLWRPGARAFFKDIRAKEIGDILKVRLKFNDNANLKNKTERSRNDGETQNVNTVLGFTNPIQKVFKDADNGTTSLDYSTQVGTSGDGKIERQEEINTTVAAVVTQVLANGALAIMGRQEIRVNAELREMVVAGVVRPQDIDGDNSIEHDKIAELRVAYGGRGTLSGLQQPRWGAQLWDTLFPF